MINYKEILLTGTNGMLGKSMINFFPRDIVEVMPGKKKIDLTNEYEVDDWIKDRMYKYIIHSAAYTNLDFCEANPEKANKLHSKIIEKFNKHSEKVIYISTVPLWNDSEYYKYKNVYFDTKMKGEENTIKKESGVVIRTNIYGRTNMAGWAYENMLSNNEFHGYNQVHFNPVHVDQLSSFIFESYKKDFKNLKRIHTVSGNKILSKYQFFIDMCEKLKIDNKLIIQDNSKIQNLILKDADTILDYEEGMEILIRELKT